MKFNDKLITAIAAIVVGVLFIALKGDVLSIAFTVLGLSLIHICYHRTDGCRTAAAAQRTWDHGGLRFYIGQCDMGAYC